MMNYKPTKITLDKTQGKLVVAWNDGLVSEYPLAHLREACPCVECRGGHEFMGLEHAPKDLLKLTPKRSYDVSRLEPVGNYAIQPTWDDGHDSGMYTWEYLRHIAPESLDSSE